MRVAYVVSRFPKITETFVLREALALEALGAEVHVFPLVSHEERIVQPEVARFAGRVHRVGPLSPAALWALVASTVLAPRRTLSALAGLAEGVGGSWAHTVRALVLLPRVFWLARQLERLGVVHVHAHFATHPALAALVARRLCGVPYSFTAHGSDLHRDPRGVRAKVLDAAFAVTVSDYNRAFIEEHGGRDLGPRIEVIRCGVDLHAFAPRPVEPPGPAFRVACVAALREVKGHEYLLRACRRLVDDGVDLHCELAGEGDLRAELERLVRELGLAERVRFLGAVTSPEVRALLERSHVAVLSSVLDREGRREGVPVSLMEAMALGLPVVSSELSGIPELVTHGVDGLLAPPRDEGAIAAALRSLAADPALRARLGARGRQTVLERYDLQRNAQQLATRISRELTGAEPGIAEERRVAPR